MTLSETMQGALSAIEQHGELVRKPGGFWTAENTPEKNGVPEWHFSTSTIQGLINRKMLVGTESMRRGDPWKVRKATPSCEPHTLA
jgi:hypothetical protein